MKKTKKSPNKQIQNQNKLVFGREEGDESEVV